MPSRIRTIKPDFFTSADIVDLSPLARLLFIALWCEADREGRLRWRPATFKLRYLPGDDCDVEALAAELIAAGLVVLYGEGLAFIPTFTKHQVVNNREAASVLSDPHTYPTRDDACLTRADASVGEGKGKEGKGKEDASVTRDAAPSAEASKPGQRKSELVRMSSYDVIVSTYHDALPHCRRWNAYTDKRRNVIVKAERLARTACHDAGIAYDAGQFWPAYFARCALDPWMAGDVRNPNNSRWRQSLETLVDDQRFADVMDGVIDELREGVAHA